MGDCRASDRARIEGGRGWSGIRGGFDGSRGNYRSVKFHSVSRRVHLQVRCIDDFHIVFISLFVYMILSIQYSCVKSVERIRKR